MATADVLVLRSTGIDDEGAAEVGDAWPGVWLPALLAAGQEERTVDDVVHRYRGARLLHTAGCRWVDVTGSPADPTTVRLTLVWDEDASVRERDAVVSWWVEQGGRAGWEASESDELVGPVVVARYVPTEAPFEADGGAAGVLHDWEPPQASAPGARTSGRRT